MNYLESYGKRLSEQLKNVPEMVNTSLLDKSKEIIKLNIEQIDNHEGSDGRPLINDVRTASGKRKYKGVYSELTEDFAANGIPSYPEAQKKAGNPYNWVWTGDFVSNFVVEQKRNKIQVYSTGTGSGEKKEFFDGYKNLYGLQQQNEEMIFGHVKAFVINKMLSNLWG